MDNNNKSVLTGAEKAVLVIFMILALFGLAANVMWFESAVCTGTTLIGGIATTIVFLGVFYYGIIGYKEPHSNVLKYIMLLFAVCYGIFTLSHVLYGTTADYILGILGFLAAIAISYMSGRLDRINQNKIIVIIITMLIAIGAMLAALSMPTDWGLMGFEMVVYIVYSISPLLCWLALSASYFVRYRMHRESGFKEKKD